MKDKLQVWEDCLIDKAFKLIGTACLAVAVLITVTGPTSSASVAVEEVHESIKNNR